MIHVEKISELTIAANRDFYQCLSQSKSGEHARAKTTHYSKEEKSFGFCVFVYILCVFVYILWVFVYVFLGSQSQGSYISREFVVDL